MMTECEKTERSTTDGVWMYYLFDGDIGLGEYNAVGTPLSGVTYGNGIDESRDWGNCEIDGFAGMGNLRDERERTSPIIARGREGGQFALPDRNGNTAVVTGLMVNNLAPIREQYRYDAFGAVTFKDAAGTVIPSSAILNRFLFTGREWAPQYGFYEYRARAYHPGLGRFMSEDPKGFDAGDYNLYRYCANDPLDKTDPLGLYAMGIGWTPEQWNNFDRAQRVAANRAAAAAERIDKALADAKGNKSTIKAFDKVFGKGSATAGNMSRVSQNFKDMVTALRDDGTKGYIANGISAAEVASQHYNATTTLGIGAIGGKTIQVNLDHRASSSESALTWMAGHESAHNIGLPHGELNGVTAYKYGTLAQRDAYENLPSDERLHNPGNYMDFAR